jgi:hypothetical protein
MACADRLSDEDLTSGVRSHHDWAQRMKKGSVMLALIRGGVKQENRQTSIDNGDWALLLNFAVEVRANV